MKYQDIFHAEKSLFSALIKLQILHMHVHVLFSPVALSLCWSFDAPDVSATISDKNLRSHGETLSQMLDDKFS